MGKFERTAGDVAMGASLATGASDSRLQLELSDDLFWLIYLIFAYFSKKWSPGEAQVEPGPPLPPRRCDRRGTELPLTLLMLRHCIYIYI